MDMAFIFLFKQYVSQFRQSKVHGRQRQDVESSFCILQSCDGREGEGRVDKGRRCGLSSYPSQEDLDQAEVCPLPAPITTVSRHRIRGHSVLVGTFKGNGRLSLQTHSDAGDDRGVPTAKKRGEISTKSWCESNINLHLSGRRVCIRLSVITKYNGIHQIECVLFLYHLIKIK